jgi:hypothetical protein
LYDEISFRACNAEEKFEFEPEIQGKIKKQWGTFGFDIEA